MDQSRSRSKRRGRFERVRRAVKSAAASTGSVAAAASQQLRRSKSSSGSDHSVQAALATARSILGRSLSRGRTRGRLRSSKSRKVGLLDLEGYQRGEQIDELDVEGFLRTMEQLRQRRLKFVVLSKQDGKTVRSELPRSTKLIGFKCKFEVLESSPSGAAEHGSMEPKSKPSRSRRLRFSPPPPAGEMSQLQPQPPSPPLVVPRRRSRIRTPTPTGAACRRENSDGSASASEVGLAAPPLPPEQPPSTRAPVARRRENPEAVAAESTSPSLPAWRLR